MVLRAGQAEVDGPRRMTIILVMAKKQPFALIYDPEAAGHLDAIEPKYHSLIRNAIEEQLRFEAKTSTRNRKPLERPIGFGATWELRLGTDNRFRVFYRVDAERQEVRILAIGVKDRNRLLIAGKEVAL
jgi:mRNA-degrading endonuclease RelE of RelBE toxin-antitoxin system